MTQRKSNKKLTSKKAPAKKQKKKPLTAPHSKFSEKLFNDILMTISTTEKGLHKCCKEHGISYVTFHEWLIKDENLAKRYARAKELQLDIIAEQILELSSNERQTTEEKEGMNASGIFSESTKKDNYNRTRLEIDARKWLLAKLNPKKYGDKVDVTSGGKEMPAPVIISLGSGVKPNDDESTT